jgi:D-alanyl-D-alanine carboxypeptidase
MESDMNIINKNMKQKFLFLLVFVVIIASICMKSQNTEEYRIHTFTPEDSIKSIKYLSSQISKILSDPALKNTKFEIAIYSLENKKYFFKKNIDEFLTPASITKLFTCLTALHSLKSDFKIITSVYTTGDIKNGVLNGDIYIYGRGDALLKTSDLENLAGIIKSKGIIEIRGNVYADGSYFDKIEKRVEYSGDREVVQALQPVTALSLENNVVTITVEGIPQGKAKYSSVKTNPPSDAFIIQNSSKVLGDNIEHKRSQKQGNLVPKGIMSEEYGGGVRFITAALKNGIHIIQKSDVNNAQSFQITGNIESGQTYSYSYFISDPVIVVAGTFKRILTHNGIVVNGTFGEKELKSSNNSKQYLIAENERYLVDIISPTMKNSDNYLAENVFKIIGANSGKMRDNAKEAKQIILKVLDTINVPCMDCQFNDGSGLSRRNKVSAESVIRLLESTYYSPLRHILDTTMAIAGYDGTIRNRMIGTLAEQNLKAKTGTHSNVSGLSGLVKTLDGEQLAFSFIFNGGNVGVYKQIENQLGILLSEFFYFNREN